MGENLKLIGRGLGFGEMLAGIFIGTSAADAMLDKNFSEGLQLALLSVFGAVVTADGIVRLGSGRGAIYNMRHLPNKS